MKISISKKDTMSIDAIIIPITKSLEIKTDICNLQKDVIDEYIAANLFKGNSGELYNFTRIVNSKPMHSILVGVGEDVTDEKIFLAVSAGIQKAQSLDAKTVRIKLDNLLEFESIEMLKKTVLGAKLGEYKYEPFKTVGKKTIDIESVEIITCLADEKEALQEAVVLAESIIEARDLTNTPANLLKPTQLGEMAIVLGRKYGFNVTILGKSEIEELKMNAFLAVAQGSDSEPKLIVMEYNNDDSKDIIALVGKGITYDSGGYSIKPTNSMVSMKNDMGGASAVIGAMCAIAKNKLKTKVVAIVAACENMISGHAILPGDIVSSMCGKTIEISNTDAEGRLTLIDAVHYAIKVKKASKVIDLATLTGAVVGALGDQYAGVVGNDKSMMDALKFASNKSGEKVWEMPFTEDVCKINKSQIADLINSPKQKMLGCSVGGAFVSEGVDGKPWVHVDIAGVADFEQNRSYCRKGGSGFGVNLVYEFVKKMN